MSYYTPTIIEDLKKLKNIINQRKDIEKLRLNEKIQETQNYDLAEQYAPITKSQKEQAEALKQARQEQVQAIEDRTEAIQALAGPPIKAVEPPENLPS